MAIDFPGLLEKVQAEISFVNTTIKDKGSNRFSRPILIGGLMVFGAYWFVYAPPGKKMAGLAMQLNTAKSTAQFADAYKDVRLRLYSIYPKLPRPGQPSLTANIIESLRLENIISDSLQPPSEAEQGGLLLQSVSASMTVSFAELVAWLLRLEAHSPVLHLTSLEVRKRSRQKYEAQVVVSTIVPKVRY